MGRILSNRSEGAIQRDIVHYLYQVLIPKIAVVYANANASRRTATGRASNAVPGLLPGIPDLSIVTTGGVIHFIEVKRPGGVLSPAQKEILLQFDGMGVPYVVAYGIDDVRLALNRWRIPTRESRLQIGGTDGCI